MDPAARAQRGSAVFVWNDRALFLGDRSETGLHAHNAIEISAALDADGIDLRADGEDLRAVGGAIVRSDTPHRLSIRGPKVAVLYLDARSAVGPGLTHWLGDRTAAPLPDAVVAAHRPRLHALFDTVSGLADANEICKGLVAALALEPVAPRHDERVRRATAYLDARLDRPPTGAELAAHTGLSASRLSRLFKAQVGLPVRRYVLWKRLRMALVKALSGSTMTEAAHAAGFADSAHFTRTCQRMFGLPPTAFAPVDAVFVAPVAESTGRGL